MHDPEPDGLDAQGEASGNGLFRSMDRRVAVNVVDLPFLEHFAITRFRSRWHSQQLIKESSASWIQRQDIH
jgi:hypothetical protein